MTERTDEQDEKKPAEKGDRPSGPTLPFEMRWWAQWILGLVGVVLLTVGCWATFKADNDLGTVAVVVVGSLFLAAAALGRWPNRLGWGDKYVEWYGAVLGRVLAEASPETQEEVREIAAEIPAVTRRDSLDLLLVHPRIRDLQNDSNWRRWQAARALIYQLRSFLPAPVDYQIVPDGGASGGVHAVIRVGRGMAQRIGVVASAIGTGDLDETVTRALTGPWGAVLVVKAEYEDPGLPVVSAMPRVFVADLGEDSAQAVVERAIESVRHP